MESVVIPTRYRGPAHSGNGGYVAGTLAQFVADQGAVEVSLRQPPPLDTDLLVEPDPQGEGMRLTFGGSVIATARASEEAAEPIPAVGHDAAVAASASYPGLRFHPFPTCYVCGTGREDGLRIFPGRVDDVDGRVTVAAPWTPAERERADGEVTSTATAWASLDCTGGWAGDLTDRLMVLGRMTAHLDALPRIGEPHVVMGQALGEDGRKTFTATTLYDADGRVVGRARHIWITVDADAFNAAP